MNPQHICRSCGTPLSQTFIDLGSTPVSNAYLKKEDLQHQEPTYPLHAMVCTTCFLVQLEDSEPPEHIFNETYAYFSSYSDSWLAHARQYVDAMEKKFSLTTNSQVIELASNDGYLLQYFKAKHIPVLGIEPSASVANAAIKKGIDTCIEYFGISLAQKLARSGTQADLLVANNVLAHVPDLNDFVAGMKIILKPRGIITIEFPHLLELIDKHQFDTIYHEHFSYFSLYSAQQVMERHGLRIFDVEKLPTHGGSLRLYVCHADDNSKKTAASVTQVLSEETAFGLLDLRTYTRFQTDVDMIREKIQAFLKKTAAQKLTVIGYGAPAKGNTLLNYCGITARQIIYTVDRSPHKQGMFLPGTHIPIERPEKIKETKPDLVVILPWNIKSEIMEQQAYIKEWGGKFAVLIPEVHIL